MRNLLRLTLLTASTIVVRASLLLPDAGVIDMDGDGDIDADDLASWEQQRIHSELEHVNELPWWAPDDADEKEYGTEELNGRMLAMTDAEVDDKQLMQDIAGRLEAQKNAANQNNRRTSAKRRMMMRRKNRTTRSSIAVTNGYCLPPPRKLFTSRSLCQGKRQRCGGASGTCCEGLVCKRKRDGKRCRTTCKGPGRECSVGATCCGQQCVLCSGGCQGRCGLGIEQPKDNIQAFYYPWYSNEEVDGKYRHWAIFGRGINGGQYSPKDKDLPANYYPTLGSYSSSSQETVNTHMEWLTRAGVGTVIVSWWGEGSYEDRNMWMILNAADDYGLKVGFYIEPYRGGYVRDPASNVTEGTRTPETARDDVKYIIDTYGCHRAMYRRKGRPVIMFFAARTYDRGDQVEWKLVWDELHADPKYNPIVIAHDVNLNGRIIKGGWDGGHDYGTEAAFGTSAGWSTLATSYATASKLLYFTVSPGFDNSRLMLPNKPIISRQDGLLYHTFWLRAIAKKYNSNPVIITSFNEWHEGTQIEPVDVTTIAPYVFNGENRSAFTYQDYEEAWGLNGTAASFAYLDWTKKLSDLYLAA